MRRGDGDRNSIKVEGDINCIDGGGSGLQRCECRLRLSTRVSLEMVIDGSLGNRQRMTFF